MKVGGISLLCELLVAQVSVLLGCDMASQKNKDLSYTAVKASTLASH